MYSAVANHYENYKHCISKNVFEVRIPVLPTIDKDCKPNNMTVTNCRFINIHTKIHLVIINQKIICCWIKISAIYSSSLLKEFYSIQNDILKYKEWFCSCSSVTIIVIYSGLFEFHTNTWILHKINRFFFFLTE